jgi:hypothetical protein
MSLPYRLFVVNFGILCVLAWAWWIGLAKLVIEADTVHMGAFIAALFFVGLLSAFQQARLISRQATVFTLASRRRYAKRIRITSAHLSTVVFVLFSLGIIGTGLGLITGLHGISFGSTAEAAQKFGGQVIAGITASFGATVIGATCGVWTEINARMINTAISLLELDAE